MRVPTHEFYFIISSTESKVKTSAASAILNKIDYGEGKEDGKVFTSSHHQQQPHPIISTATTTTDFTLPLRNVKNHNKRLIHCNNKRKNERKVHAKFDVHKQDS